MKRDIEAAKKRSRSKGSSSTPARRLKSSELNTACVETSIPTYNQPRPPFLLLSSSFEVSSIVAVDHRLFHSVLLAPSGIAHPFLGNEGKLSLNMGLFRVVTASTKPTSFDNNNNNSIVDDGKSSGSSRDASTSAKGKKEVTKSDDANADNDKLKERVAKAIDEDIEALKKTPQDDWRYVGFYFYLFTLTNIVFYQ